MRYLFNLVYLMLALACSPWLVYKTLVKGKYRQGWWVKLTGRVPPRRGSAPCAWLHAVSVGEVMLLEPFLKQFRTRFPDWDLVVTATTRTGWDLARRRHADHAAVYYCPLDFSWAVTTMLRRIQPHLLVLVELELWPNLIAAARREQVKVAIINGRLSESSFRGYRRIGWVLRPTIRRIDLIAAQNAVYAARFRALGSCPRAVHVTGSLKFDGALGDRENPQTRELARLSRVRPEEIILLAGSTQAPEEETVLNVFRRLATEFPQLRLIITPRHAERFDEVARLLDCSGVAWTRRSRLGATSVDERLMDGRVTERVAKERFVRAGAEAGSVATIPPKQDEACRILLVDTIGELRAWWGLSHMAFVGGSMGSRGGQNMLEPAGMGAAVCFGPKTRNFRDIVQMLLEADAAEVVTDEDQLSDFVRRCITDPAYRIELGQRARRVVAGHQGAARETVEQIAQLFEQGIVRPRDPK